MLPDRQRDLVEQLRDRDYRIAFRSAEIKTGLSFQIKTMRKDRGWRQEDLATRVGKTQSFISSLENPDRGAYTLRTLEQLADGFDVGLSVRFVPYTGLAHEAVSISRESISPLSFDDDYAALAARSFTFEWRGIEVQPENPVAVSNLAAGAVEDYVWKSYSKWSFATAELPESEEVTRAAA